MTDEDDIKIVEPKENSIRLSSSQISTFEQCPRKWKYRYIDKIYGESTIAMVMGTFVHSIFEDLFKLDKKDRTQDSAKTIARTNWEKLVLEEEFLNFQLDEKEQKDFRINSWNLVNRLWELERPEMVDVVEVEMKVEFDVCEGVSLIGFIDRVSDSNGQMEIVDYKTGKRPRKNYEDDKVNQIFLYGLALHKIMDEELGKGKLLFLGGTDPGIISRKITSQVVEDTEKKLLSDALQISSARSADSHEAKTGPLCGWCDFFPYCSEGQDYVIERLSSGSFRKDAPAALMLKDEEFIASVKALSVFNAD